PLASTPPSLCYQEDGFFTDGQAQINPHRLRIRGRPPPPRLQPLAVVRQPGGESVLLHPLACLLHQVRERGQRHELAVGEEMVEPLQAVRLYADILRAAG